MRHLPKPTSFTFHSNPYIPRERRPEAMAKARTFHHKAFSGPMVSIVPEEARRRKKADEFDTQEPSSPKISCLGRITEKKKKKKGWCKRPPPPPPPPARQEKRMSTSSSAIQRMFRRKVRPDRRQEDVEGEAAVASGSAAPAIGQMRRFASKREGLAGFDWREVDRRVKGGDDDDDEEEEVIIPHSAPILMGGGGVAVEPKKEVNIWKRRPMAPPVPLQVSS